MPGRRLRQRTVRERWGVRTRCACLALLGFEADDVDWARANLVRGQCASLHTAQEGTTLWCAGLAVRRCAGGRRAGAAALGDRYSISDKMVDHRSPTREVRHAPVAETGVLIPQSLAGALRRVAGRAAGIDGRVAVNAPRAGAKGRRGSGGPSLPGWRHYWTARGAGRGGGSGHQKHGESRGALSAGWSTAGASSIPGAVDGIPEENVAGGSARGAARSARHQPGPISECIDGSPKVNSDEYPRATKTCTAA